MIALGGRVKTDRFKDDSHTGNIRLLNEKFEQYCSYNRVNSSGTTEKGHSPLKSRLAEINERYTAWNDYSTQKTLKLPSNCFGGQISVY